MNSLLSLNAFKGMEGLTHLDITFPNTFFDETIDERFFTNIDINLPNLQLLKIKTKIRTDLKGYQLIADSLSRLSKLHTIYIDIEKESIQEMFKTKLIKNCTKIKSFFFVN